MAPEMPRTGFGMVHSRSRIRKCTLSRSIVMVQYVSAAEPEVKRRGSAENDRGGALVGSVLAGWSGGAGHGQLTRPRSRHGRGARRPRGAGGAERARPGGVGSEGGGAA